MSASCPACLHDNFTITGLSQHLAKSRNPECQALYQQSCSQIHTNASEPPSEPNNPDDELGWPDDDGGYGIEDGMEEFEWAPEQSGHGSDTDDGSDDEAYFKPEWEPPVEQQDDHSHMDAVDDLAEEEDQHHNHQDIQERCLTRM
ncbi:hypothetical protein EDD22DRAFT_854321 [Suillus occidentalis]|nr:hypothetical protein EDD22DRAFT_854321 [Suillus occidentalis]